MAIQFRRGTEASWLASSEILLPGQPGVAYDTGEVRTGDGLRTWKNLPNNSALAKVSKNELVFNVRDYGAKGDSVTDDIAAIQTTITAATLGGGGRGAVVFFPAGIYLINAPIMLPRTGSTPLGVVEIQGVAPRVSAIAGSNAFPAGRALIEWDAVTSRTWHQSITDLTLTPAAVAGCRAVHYKRNGTGTTLADFNNERMQITMRRVLIEGHNGFNPSLVKLEGQVFYSNFEQIWGDCRVSSITNGYQPLTDYDTVTLEFDSNIYSDPVSSDIVGLSYSTLKGCTAGSLRRGGRGVVLRGKIKASTIESVWSDGTRYDPGLDLINSFNVDVVNPNNEGRSGTQIRLKNSRAIRLRNFALSSQDPEFPDWTASTAYATTQGVIVPGWRTATVPPAPTNNNWYACTTSGTSGSSQPSWPTTVGATVTDGSVVWTCRGPAVQDALVIDGGDGIVVDRMTVGPGLPQFTARGCKPLRLLNSPTNVSVNGAVPGNPATEIAWIDTAGQALISSSAGHHVTFGTDLFATAAADQSAIRSGTYRTPRGSSTNSRGLTLAQEFAVPIDMPAGTTIDRLGISITIAVASGVVRLGIREDNNGYPGALLLDAGTVDASTTGPKEVAGFTVATTGLRVWLVAVGQGAAGIVSAGVNGPVWPVESSSLAVATTGLQAAHVQSGVTGALGVFPASQGTVAVAPLIAARAA